MGCAYPRKQNAQIIQHFGDSADGGTRVFADRFLLDGDGRAETADVIYFGFFHLPQKLPGIGRETFDIAPLAFGVDGVEGQGGFAAAADAGEDDELVAGNGDVDVFEVVLLCAANDDAVGFHRVRDP